MAGFSECPNLAGTYQERENLTVQVEQFEQDGFLIYRSKYSNGLKLDMKVGAHETHGESTTDTFCKGNAVIIRYYAKGVLSWSAKNQVFPSDISHEAEIGALIEEARSLKQDLRYEHEVLYTSHLVDGGDFQTDTDSHVAYFNLSTNVVSNFQEHTYNRLKRLLDSYPNPEQR